MLRTQIYLTKSEKESLLLLSKKTGLHQSALIRDAIDQFIEAQMHKRKQKRQVLKSAAGMWAGREDLLDERKLRREFERDYAGS